MKSPFRLVGIGVFVAVFALISLVYILFADFFVAKSIRTAGSQVVGAMVDLDNAELNLAEEKLTLNKLAVTNPKSPMTNAVELDYLELDIDSSALTWNKVIIDNIKVTNLLMNTPRESTGELSSHWTDVVDWEPLADIQDLGAMSADKLPDPAEIIAQEELQTLKAIDAFNVSLATAESELNTQLAALPDDDKIQSYKDRFKKIKDSASGGNKLLGLLSKGKDFKALRGDLKADLKTIKQFKNTLQAQRKILTADLNNLKDMPQQDLNRLKQKYSLSGDGVANLVNSVFGPQIGGWMSEGYGYYQLIAPYLNQMEGTENDAAQASQVLTDRGRRVIFDDENPLPNYLIKAINISTSEVGEHLSINGIINNLTSEPQRWSEPLEMQLGGSAPFLSSFSLKGLFDHRSAENSSDNVTVGVTGLKLASVITDSQKDMPVTPTGGSIDINAEIKMINEQLDSRIRLNFKQVTLDVSDPSPWVMTIADGLSKLPEFEVVIDLKGTITEPTTEISAPDLSKLSQQVMKSLLSDELQGFENELMEQIKSATDNPLANLPGLDSLDNLQKQLNLKELDLNNLLKNLG